MNKEYKKTWLKAYDSPFSKMRFKNHLEVRCSGMRTIGHIDSTKEELKSIQFGIFEIGKTIRIEYLIKDNCIDFPFETGVKYKAEQVNEFLNKWEKK